MPSFTVFKGSESGAIQSATTTKPDLQNDDVFLRVTASGLCGTDEHYKTAGCALGHEGVGVVESVGPAVTRFKSGDRVGWGYQHYCCGNCEECLSGHDTYCPERKMYGEADLDQGSFASHAVWSEKFLYAIPDELSDTDAAPLMCGGATVFGTLYGQGIDSTSRVGVIGIGGLGHLAIQFAAKMGCEVVVFSSTDSKKDEAMKLGASTFIATKDKKELDVGDKKLDALIVTTSFNPDWAQMLSVLKPRATIFPLTVHMGNFEIPQMPLIVQGLRVQGSAICTRHVHRKMLAFAAQHGIKPVTQEFPMTAEGIEEAMSVLRDGKMRYRGVLVPKN